MNCKRNWNVSRTAQADYFSLELKGNCILVWRKSWRLSQRLEDCLYVTLQKEAPLATEIMCKGDINLSGAYDLTVFEETRIIGGDFEIIQSILYGKVPPLGSDVCPRNVLTSRVSGFNYRLIRRCLQDVLEARRWQLYHVKPLHWSIVVGVCENELIEQGVDTDVLLFCVFLENVERGFVQPE